MGAKSSKTKASNKGTNGSHVVKPQPVEVTAQSSAEDYSEVMEQTKTQFHDVVVVTDPQVNPSLYDVEGQKNHSIMNRLDNEEQKSQSNNPEQQTKELKKGDIAEVDEPSGKFDGAIVKLRRYDNEKQAWKVKILHGRDNIVDEEYYLQSTVLRKRRNQYDYDREDKDANGKILKVGVVVKVVGRDSSKKRVLENGVTGILHRYNTMKEMWVVKVKHGLKPLIKPKYLQVVASGEDRITGEKSYDEDVPPTPSPGVNHEGHKKNVPVMDQHKQESKKNSDSFTWTPQMFRQWKAMI